MADDGELGAGARIIEDSRVALGVYIRFGLAKSVRLGELVYPRRRSLPLFGRNGSRRRQPIQFGGVSGRADDERTHLRLNLLLLGLPFAHPVFLAQHPVKRDFQPQGFAPKLDDGPLDGRSRRLAPAEVLVGHIAPRRKRSSRAQGGDRFLADHLTSPPQPCLCPT